MLNLLRLLKTACRKVNLTYSPDVCIVGDPIIDIYPSKICDGGVLNVINNYKHFSQKEPLVVIPPKRPFFSYSKRNERNYSITNNKEFLNKETPAINADLVVVDSKYNTFDLKAIEKVKTKILHVSRTDKKNPDFLKAFDYIIETNDKDKIFIFNSDLNLLAEVIPPKAKAVCEFGAGDTFVAVLTECLDVEPSFMNIKKSVKIAAYAAADVVQKPYTSITTLKKADICTLLTSMN
jgi:hypothetical protein